MGSAAPDTLEVNHPLLLKAFRASAPPAPQTAAAAPVPRGSLRDQLRSRPRP